MISCRSWMPSEKGNFVNEINLGIGHNRSTRKKRNPNSNQELDIVYCRLFFHNFYDVAIIASRARGA